MSKKKRTKAQVRKKRFKEWPYCELCDCELVLFEQQRGRKVPLNAAVLMSNYSRYTPELRQRGHTRWMLLCRSCADERSKIIQKTTPIDLIREKSNAWPVSMMVGS